MLKLFGPAESVYVRIVRMVLAEKSIDAAVVEFDVFDQTAHPEGYDKLHPFSKAPALSDGDFSLFETTAIVHYLEQKYPEPALTPSELQQRARMNQAIAIVDNYAYPSMVWGLYVEQVANPKHGKTINPVTVKAAESHAEKCIDWLSRQLNQNEWIASNTMTLADLYFASIMLYFAQTKQGQQAIKVNGAIENWWTVMSSKLSVKHAV